MRGMLNVCWGTEREKKEKSKKEKIMKNMNENEKNMNLGRKPENGDFSSKE